MRSDDRGNMQRKPWLATGRLVGAGVPALLLLAVGCGGSGTPDTLGGACQSLASAGCSRSAECGAPVPDNCEATVVDQCCQSGQCGTQLPQMAKDALGRCLTAIGSLDCAALAAGQLPDDCTLSNSTGGDGGDGGDEGCATDSECGSGQICDDFFMECMDGCREDTQCGDGEICDTENDLNYCRTGCRTDSQCPEEGKICDDLFLRCVQGCRLDSDCNQEFDEVCNTTNNLCE